MLNQRRFVLKTPAGWVVFLSICFVLAACTQTREDQPRAAADLVDLQGTGVGTVRLEEMPDGVRIHLQITRFPPGTYAAHIHERGDFTPPNFEAAGAHFNPYHKEHGLQNPKGPHAGDMPNFTVKPDGTADVETMNSQVTLRPGFENSLLRAGGTSLIIHEHPDDYRTDPAGDAGARIAGGIIRAGD
jgi:superoxide dismutase, Cu-Zn family